ncbi:MAG: amidohydrolase, partial [Candidatus Aminicenantales bacterium]
GLDLRGVKSRREFVAKIKKKVKEVNEGEWILNGNWDHHQFRPPLLPNKEWIDDITSSNPVCLNRVDGHLVLANSLALKIAGITKDTPSPPGGEIVKDPQTGDPTGILKDAAVDLLRSHIPQPSFKDKIKAAQEALRKANEVGLTSIHDMGFLSNLEVYRKLWQKNKLTARICLYLPITEVSRLSSLQLDSIADNDFLKVGGFKGFIDGSLGSETALFFESYVDNPAHKGLFHSQMFPEGIMAKRILEADKAGFQVAIHAIGDRANHVLFDILERIQISSSHRERRWRCEHAQHLLPEDIGRMAQLGVIASVQPYHLVEDGCWAEKKIGKKRCGTSYAYKSLLEEGIRLTCGSDWPVAPLNPLTGVYAAVSRKTLDGKNPEGWFPEQKIPLEEVIKGYTINPAYAEFANEKKGSIEKGKLADLLVLDQNLFDLPVEALRQVAVRMTIVNGKIVFSKQPI